MNRYKKQLIKVVTTDKIPVLIDGKTRGSFAIHECLDRFFIPAKRSGIDLKYPDCKVFSVTHLPTGNLMLTSTIGQCQMFINKIINMPWHLIKVRNGKPPDGFPIDEYKSYLFEFSID